METSLFKDLTEINTRPKPFEVYTAEELWTDSHTSVQMLGFHLNESVDISSRNINFINQSADWFISRFNLDADAVCADFGCGPGLYTIRFARTGAKVTGIDFSERSVRYAKEVAAKEGLEINYVRRNYLEYETDKRFDLITMIMCDFCALSPPQRKTMLRKFHRFLNPGGSVLLDVYSLNAYDRREEVATYEKNLLNGFWSAEPYYGFLNTFKYGPEKVVLDKYTIVEKTRIRAVYNWLQYFSRESLEKEFTENGFAADVFYSDVGGAAFNPDSLEIAIAAQKI
jgi:SAM-dependent methyltransferase